MSRWGVEGPGVRIMDDHWDRAACERIAETYNAAFRAGLESRDATDDRDAEPAGQAQRG